MTIEYIDAHAHLNFAAFKDDVEAVIDRAHKSGVAIINVGTQKNTSARALEIAKKYEEGVYAAVGLHPIHSDKSFHDKKELGEPIDFAQGAGDNTIKGFISRGEVFDPVYYRNLAENPKVVAIGECGLDYYRGDMDSIAKQRSNFISQIVLANELRKPLMLHIRAAHDDAYEIIKTYATVRGNVHFFTGTKEQAKKFLDLGFTLSFTGVITLTRDYDDTIKYLPLESILSETDCPYVTPELYRGRRNEPSYVVEIVKRIAEIKCLDLEKIKKQLADNALRFFKIY